MHVDGNLTELTCGLDYYIWNPERKHGHARRVRLEITDSGSSNKSVVLGPTFALTRYRYSRTASKPKTVHGADVIQPRDGKSELYTRTSPLKEAVSVGP